MEFIPHKYQKMAIQKVIDTPRVGLFLDMGLGKTVITLTAIDQLMYWDFEIEKVLVIAPLRVAEYTWSTECQKWEHLKHIKIVNVLGKESQREKAICKKGDIYIINRENIVWLVQYLKQIGKKWFFDMTVIDELSSFKSPKSQRFKALKKYIMLSKRVVGLTGTPAPNGFMDLWSQLYLIDGGERLGKTLTYYREKYFMPNQRNATTIFNYTVKKGAENAIKQQISDICMSMQANDWLDLPQRMDLLQTVQFSELERKRYEKFEKDSYLQFLNEEITANSAAALTNKLLQYCNGAVYTEKDVFIETNRKKLEKLEEIVDTANGQAILCFYNFKFDCERICKKFPFAVKLQGQKDISDWNNGEISLLLVHPKSAGHGLNLQQGGNIIVWFGLNWSLELYQQANARLHRQGQQKTVIIHHLIVENSIEQRVFQSLQKKENVQEGLLQALKVKYERQDIKGVALNNPLLS